MKRHTLLDHLKKLLERENLDARQLATRVGSTPTIVGVVLNRHADVFVKMGRSEINKNAYVWALRQGDTE